MKRLIDEKVLQRYYYEKFTKANPTFRKKLLPQEYWQYYSKDENIKGLIPERTFSKDESLPVDHRADYILLPNFKRNLEILNVEIKWDKKDFEKQKNRFRYYNGTSAKGFVVCLNIENQDSSKYIMDNGNPTNIPVVYLEADKFKDWFIVNAEDIINESISSKFNMKVVRRNGKKFWVVALASEKAYSNYINHCRRNQNLWAFRDSMNAKNIFEILEDHYIIFVRVEDIKPYNRQIYPYSDNMEKEFGSGRKDKNTCKSAFIDWNITLIDILQVSGGYSLKLNNEAPYDVFESQKLKKGDIYKKEYTQFISVKYSKEDEFQFYYDGNKHPKFNRILFPEENDDFLSFVDALRESYNSKGDAREITKENFLSIVRFLKQYK